MESGKIKALFFAQYLGQKVFCLNENDRILSVLPCDLTGTLRKRGYLSLRAIEKISDDELIKCYHLHSADIGYDYTQDFENVLTMAHHWISIDGYKVLLKYRSTSDYLRRIGILIPFIYLNEQNQPITLSCETIVEKGWCVIKEG
jgi:hypothetical protein